MLLVNSSALQQAASSSKLSSMGGRAFMVSLAVDLSPMTRMCSDFGPMNSMPWSAQMSTKVAFSERKP